ncbi:hypothetical protein DSM110093_03728 (plasmid) [Sulfitobacter sp. DSM 110093]|nr:hypothetical protein DSM110093_03728 [Sulfitobacter sp. DSM 110093]
MYSYEERLRAVKLYIKLGKRVQATIRDTIRELGYPTKNALRGWHQKYQRLQDLQIRSATRALWAIQAEPRRLFRCARPFLPRRRPPTRHMALAITLTPRNRLLWSGYIVVMKVPRP